jgi:hypothetical protein
MLTGETAGCLALANTAILMRLMEELAERNVMSRPHARNVLIKALSDLETCLESSSRVDDAKRIIRRELMPRISD